MYELNGQEIDLAGLQTLASKYGMDVNAYIQKMTSKGKLIEKATEPGKTSGTTVDDAAVVPTGTESASGDGSSESQETSWGDTVFNALNLLVNPASQVSQTVGFVQENILDPAIEAAEEEDRVRKSDEAWKAQEADLMEQLDIAFKDPFKPLQATLFGQEVDDLAFEAGIRYGSAPRGEKDPTKTGLTDTVKELVKEQIGGFGWSPEIGGDKTRYPGGLMLPRFDPFKGITDQWKTDFGESRYGLLTEKDINDIVDQKVGELKYNYDYNRKIDRSVEHAAEQDNVQDFYDKVDEDYRSSYEGINAQIAESVRKLTETELTDEEWDAEYEKFLGYREEKGLVEDNMLFNLQTQTYFKARDEEHKEELLQQPGIIDPGQNAQGELLQLLGQVAPENARDVLRNEMQRRALTYHDFKEEIQTTQVKVVFKGPGAPSFGMYKMDNTPMPDKDGDGLLTWDDMESMSVEELLHDEQLLPAKGRIEPMTWISPTKGATYATEGMRQLSRGANMMAVAPQFIAGSERIAAIQLPDGTIINDEDRIDNYIATLQQDDFAYSSEYNAAADMYYLNEGLADIEKPSYTFGLPTSWDALKASGKAIVRPWADDYYADQLIGFTGRDKQRAAEEVYDQLGVKTTKEEQEALNVTMSETVNEGLLGANKMLYEFKAMNHFMNASGVTSGYAAVTNNLKTGKYVSETGKVYSKANMAARARAAGYGDDIAAYAEKALGGKVLLQPTTIDKGIDILSAGLMEGAKFSAFEYYDFAQGRFKGADEKTPYSFWTGFGFGAAGRLLAPLSPYLSKKGLLKDVDKRVFGRDFGVNSRKLFENFVTQPSSFVAGSEFGEIMNNLVSSAMGDTKFSEFLSEHYGHLDEVGKRLVSQYFIGVGFGMTHSNPFADLKSSKAILRTKDKQYRHLIDKYGTLGKLTNVEKNNFFTEQVQKKLMNELSDNNYGDYMSDKKIYDDLSSRYFKSMVVKGYFNPATADEMIKQDHADLIKSEEAAGRKVKFEVVNNDNLRPFQKPLSDITNAEISKGPDGITTIRYNARRYSPGVMAHEVHHHFTEEILGSDAVFKADFMQNLDRIGSDIKLNRLVTESDAKELKLSEEQTGSRVGQRMTLSESIKLRYGDFTSPQGLKKAQWEIFAHIAEAIGNKKNYEDILESNGFSNLKELISPLGKRVGKKLNLSRQQDVVEWFAKYAENVKKGKTPVKLFEQLKEVIDPELSRIAEKEKNKLESDAEKMASEDLEAIGQTEADNARIKKELDNYYKNNLSNKTSISLDDLKELQGQKKRGDRYDIDMESPYTDFENYPVLGNVLGRSFDQAVRIYQRNIPERYRINLNDRSYESERTELANEVLGNEKRGLLDIIRRYDPSKGTLKSWVTGQLAMRMQELKAESVDVKYESRRAEAEGVVVSGTDISELKIDLTEVNKGGGVDKFSDKLGINEEPAGIKLREHMFEFEGGVQRTINPESVRRVTEAGETVFNETPVEDLTFMGVATRMRGEAMSEMDLLFRNGKDVKKPKDIQAVEKIFTDNVNNAAMLYDAMPEFSHPKHYENTQWGKTVFKVFYEKTGEKFKSTDLPVELTKKTNARTEKYKKLPATPERIQEFVDLMNTGRDAGVKNKKRDTLKQGVGDIFTTQTFREMITNPEFRQRAESTPEGKAKLKALDAELAVRKLRGATPEKLFSEDVDVFNDFLEKIKTFDWAKEPSAGFFIRNEIENNSQLKRIIEESYSIEEFLKDSTYDLKDVDLQVFEEYHAAARELDALTYTESFAPEMFSGGYSGTKNNPGVDQAIVEAVLKVKGGKKIVELLNVTDSAIGKLRDAEFSKDHYDVFTPEFLNTFDPRVLSGVSGSMLGKTFGEGGIKPGHEPEVASHRSAENRLNAEWRDSMLSGLTGRKGKLPKGFIPKHVKVNDNRTVKLQVEDILEKNPKASPEKLARLIKKKLSWDGTVEGYEQTVKANELMLEYTADRIFDYIKSAKGPMAKARAINHITHMLQSQTSFGGGIFRGLATHEAISIKKGKTHSEHDFQLGNFTGNVLLDAIKNSGNKAAFKTNVKALVKSYKQSIIEKSLQEKFDKPEYGGRSSFDYLYTTASGKYMWMRELDVARTTINLSSEKTYEQLLGDVIGGNRALQKAKALGKKALVRDGLASESMDMSLDDVNMAIKIRDAALRNGRLKNKKKKGMSTFDFDETLIMGGENFVTAKRGKEIIRISSEEFPLKGPELAAAGYKFDFKDFVNVKGGVEGPLFKKLQNQISKYGNENVFVLTARMQDAAPAIHQWLKSKGVDLPIENITGLGNSTGEAKALWMLEKFARGYNDMYFVDDALSNVKAVKKVLDQLDVKSNVQQTLFSENLDVQVNDIMEFSFGIESNKRFSKAEGRMRGQKSQGGLGRLGALGGGRRKIFLPDTASDLELLIEPLYGKGKKGKQNQEWFRKEFIRPFERGMNDYNSARQKLSNDYQALRKGNKDVVKDLGKEVPDTSFTHDMAMRVYIWSKAGYKIPDLAETTKQKLVDYIEGNPKYKAYAERVAQIAGHEKGLKEPTEYWWSETIASELSDVNRGVSRQDYLSDFIERKNEIFSEENLNKMESQLGKKWRDSIEDMFDRMETGRTRSEKLSGTTGDFINYLNGSVGTIMNWNTRSALLQVISAANFVNMSFNNPARAAVAFANAPQFAKDFMKIMNSDTLKQRRQGLEINVTEAEIAAAANSKGGVKALFNQFIKAGYIPTKFADSFAISLGGATYYRNAIKKYMKEGMTKAQAEKQAWIDFQAISERTQQSNRPDLISKQQTTLAGRLILPFANTPLQMNRAALKEILDVAKGRYKNSGDAMYKLGKAGYYGFVQTLFFAGLSSGAFAFMMNSDDEEETQKKKTRMRDTVMDSSLRGMGIPGATLNGVINAIKEFNTQREKGWMADYSEVAEDLLSISPPVGAKFRQLDAAGNTYKYNREQIDEEGFEFSLDSPSLEIATRVTEATTNIPTNRYFRKANNVKNALDSDFEVWQRVLMALGWSEWDVAPDVAKDKAKNKGKDKKKEEKKSTTKSRTIHID